MTDVVMPRMGGRELATLLQRQRADLPLLSVTGDADEGHALGESARAAPVLLKPCSPAAWLTAVATALQKHGR